MNIFPDTPKIILPDSGLDLPRADWRDPRDWKRIWRDRAGLFWCCCKSAPSSSSSVPTCPCITCGFGLPKTLGAALTEAEAVAMCSLPIDGIAELEAGRLYPPGETIDGGIRTRCPHCPNHRGWQVSKGLAVAG